MASVVVWLYVCVTLYLAIAAAMCWTIYILGFSKEIRNLSSLSGIVPSRSAGRRENLDLHSTKLTLVRVSSVHG